MKRSRISDTRSFAPSTTPTRSQTYGQVAAITPADIEKTAAKYFTDANLTVATLSREPMAERVSALPSLASWSSSIPGAGGEPEYTESMRTRYAKLTREDVNRAIRRYLSAKNLQVVIVTKDAEGLRDQLIADGFSSIQYSEPKPQLTEEDKVIGSYKLNIAPAKVRITPVEEIFAR